jgi:Fe-Mn family superoxide dismutase
MFTLPDLPYKFDALEPHIDARTMEIHHDKHHAAYVKNLNEALAGHDDFLNLSIEDLVRRLHDVPENIRGKVRNNGGGHANHSLFWTVMSPQGGGEPEGSLALAINEQWGDFTGFTEEFTSAATGIFGSGWAWLVVEGDQLAIEVTPLQDNPLTNGQTPILGLDVWEHAYYLKYQNLRADYIKAWWKVVNWPEVARRLEAV